MASQSPLTDSNFALFSQLPPEIRRQIWHQCLPHRVVEMGRSHPYQASCPTHKTYYLSAIRNARRPAIASVCREAAYVARKAGNLAKFPRTAGRKEPVWLQPGRDSTLYLFENGHIAAWIGFLDPDPLLHHCIEYGMIPSLDAKYAFPSVTVDLVESDSEDLYVSTIDHFTSNTQECVKALMNFGGWEGRTLDIHVKVLHVPLDDDAMLASGLFGLLGDEPIQVVDFDDAKRLYEFYEFFQSYFSKQDSPLNGCRVTEELGYILDPLYSTKVHVWKEVVEWLMLTYMWLDEKNCIKNGKMGGDLANHALVWQPGYQTDQSVIRYREQGLDESHLWVIGARTRMWQIKPKIMIRACCNTCL